ncbi:RabGAP/TBC domain containing protein [Acanthamoeba castellanii str. Neff]|uniref:RabGAP/TBC domain containing protein n=1 Tax=Acanthamoeba castellanii (strain ATCC 30010 / Neff) TaxID=1257118 RepID=L8GZA2_ACACF|nr:RabGAP/TBC domain containing protein [Acanthamoeba castellanii str. Neff]ELR17436.1 RabGAP/TBC domain containing protein [Acanthamoeba castellanii str. Neff]
MIRRVTNAAPPPIAINSPALKRNFDVDYGKSAELSPIRTLEPVAKTDEVASKERETVHKRSRSDSQLHKLEARFAEGGPTKISPVKVKKFNTLLSQPVVDIDALKRESWSGIPPSARDITWKLLLGYLPAKQDRREGTLERKRGDYMDSIPQYYKEEHEQTASEQAIWRQIYVDILRTHQSVALFQQEAVQKVLVRVLYLWAIRHPASSYVQGINELIIPFFVVFLSTAVGKEDVEELDFGTVPADVVSMVEADCYWCLSALLDDIQDHYTSDQPGIQRLIFKLKELIRRIDLPLHAHLEKQEVHFTLFAFKWMNCLLMRELPLALVTRMWDTYLSEPEGFSTFHVYVCASFLTMWSDHLRQLEFQDIVLFLHHVPTDEWTTAEVEMLLSKAYMLKALYHDSQAHLK